MVRAGWGGEGGGLFTLCKQCRFLCRGMLSLHCLAYQWMKSKIKQLKMPTQLSYRYWNTGFPTSYWCRYQWIPIQDKICRWLNYIHRHIYTIVGTSGIGKSYVYLLVFAFSTSCPSLIYNISSSYRLSKITFLFFRKHSLFYSILQFH